MTTRDLIPFFLAWLSNPLGVAALAPSSSALADIITAEITPASAPVIELGAGTGVFTRALIAHGIPQEQLVLIEYGSDFVRLLQLRFPAARVLWMDATRLRAIDLLGGPKAGAVVSGLPLLAMRSKTVSAIVEGAFRHMRADGALYQFTYGPRCPVSPLILDRLGLEAERIGTAFANVPPRASIESAGGKRESLVSIRAIRRKSSLGSPRRSITAGHWECRRFAFGSYPLPAANRDGSAVLVRSCCDKNRPIIAIPVKPFPSRDIIDLRDVALEPASNPQPTTKEAFNEIDSNQTRSQRRHGQHGPFSISPASAHHGWGGYDSTKLVTLTGTVQEFGYQNPHANARVEVAGKTWLAVLAPPSRMQSRGLPRDAIKPGDTVTLEGYVSTSDPQELRAERIHAAGKVIELR